jgi:hypothetical protein
MIGKIFQRQCPGRGKIVVPPKNDGTAFRRPFDTFGGIGAVTGKIAQAVNFVPIAPAAVQNRVKGRKIAVYIGNDKYTHDLPCGSDLSPSLSVIA